MCKFHIERALAVLAFMGLGACAQIQSVSGYSQPTRMDVGKVISYETSKTGGSWGYGAAIGGAVGVLSGSGHSTESKIIRGAGGALAGAAVNKALTHNDVETLVVVRNRLGAMTRVKHNSDDLRVGDCVVIETKYNGDARIFRASPTQCNF